MRTQTMIRSHFEHLRRRKEYLENRHLPIRVVAEETGLSQSTVMRIKNVSMDMVFMSALETLCSYFDVKSLSELIEYEPEERQGGALEEVKHAPANVHLSADEDDPALQGPVEE